jgi:arylsulfatase A-like enzyme
MTNLDLMPTLMNVVGVEDHGGKPLDGIDILDVLTGQQSSLERELYNYIGQAGPETEQIYHMTNEWKLLVLGPQVNDDGLDDSKRRRLLYNLKDDPKETTNLAGENPDLVEEMYAKLRAFRGLMPEISIPPFLEGLDEANRTPPKEWKLPED